MKFSIPGIIFSTLTFVLAGTLLYNPIHAWGKFWVKESGMAEKMEGQKMTLGDQIFTFGGTLIAGILLSIAMGHVTATVVAYSGWSWMRSSLSMGLLLWLGFYGVATFVNTVFNGQSKKLVGLHLINGLISLLLVGLVTGFFPIK